MIKALKIAVSLPKENYEKIEEVRKKTGLNRSVIIDTAIRFWLKHCEEENSIRQYEKGYQKKPEPVNEIKVIEQMAADAFKEEGWQ